MINDLFIQINLLQREYCVVTLNDDFIMEKYKTIHEDIENVTNNQVIKKGSISFIGLSLMAVAIILAVIGMQSKDPNASWPSFLFTASAFVFLGGVIKFFVSRSCYMFRPTNSKVAELTLFYDVHEGEALKDCIEMKRFESLKSLKKAKDSGVRIQAMVANDQKFAAVQVSEYVPYTYEAVTPVVCYYGDEAKSFVNFLK